MKLSALLLLTIMNSMMTLPSTNTTLPPDYDIIIRNGRIVDGSGSAGYNADVAVKGDRIVRIGNLSQATAKRIIDARAR